MYFHFYRRDSTIASCLLWIKMTSLEMRGINFVLEVHILTLFIICITIVPLVTLVFGCIQLRKWLFYWGSLFRPLNWNNSSGEWMIWKGTYLRWFSMHSIPSWLNIRGHWDALRSSGRMAEGTLVFLLIRNKTPHMISGQKCQRECLSCHWRWIQMVLREGWKDPPSFALFFLCLCQLLKRGILVHSFHFWFISSQKFWCGRDA